MTLIELAYVVIYSFQFISSEIELCYIYIIVILLSLYC